VSQYRNALRSLLEKQAILVAMARRQLERDAETLIDALCKSEPASRVRGAFAP
jgi:hypothetical protein